MPETCHCCGEDLSEDNLAWNYLYPDDLLEADPVIHFESSTVIVSDAGAFMRVIMPVRLDDGRTATLGVWLAFTTKEDFERAMDAGRAGGDAWKSLTFTGVLVNRVEPWPDVYGAPATATVRSEGDRDPAPYLTATTQPLLAKVLTQEWPHRTFLSARNGGE